MSEEYIYPLIGVIFGWLLSSINSAFGKKYAYKTILGKGITQLVILHGDLSQTIKSLDQYKSHVNSWEDYELIRSRVMGKHFDFGGSTLNKIDEIFTEISGIDPMLSLQILGIKKGLFESKFTKMDKLCEIEEAYINVITAQETTLIITCKGLEKIIIKLSLKYSIFTYLKLKKVLSKRNNQELAENLFNFPQLNDLINKKKESI